MTEYFRNNFKTGDNINIDGIIYPSSRNGNKAIVLFANSNQCQDVVTENNLNEEFMLLLKFAKDYDLSRSI